MFQVFSKMTNICSSRGDAIFRKTRNVRNHIQWVTHLTRSDCSEMSGTEGIH